MEDPVSYGVFFAITGIAMSVMSAFAGLLWYEVRTARSHFERLAGDLAHTRAEAAERYATHEELRHLESQMTGRLDQIREDIRQLHAAINAAE